MTTNPSAREHRDEWVSYCPHLLDDGSECDCAPVLREAVEEVERLRSALNAVHNILRAEPTGGLPLGVRLTLESLARFALDAPSGSSVAPVSGFGGSQEAGT